MTSVKTLYFGKDDAESDIAKGGLLQAGFLRTAAFEAALNGSKSLIIGRKGAGKSAICLMLRACLTDEGRVSLVTPDEISADEIRRFELPGIHSAQAKQLIWRYVFDVQVAKFLLGVGKDASNAPGELKSLMNSTRRFLVDNHEVDDLSTVERFWRVVERLKGSISLEAFGAKIGADVAAPSPGIRVHNSLDMFEEKLTRLGQLIDIDNSGKPFHLLVDQIEKVWSNDVDSDAMVVGVLLASKAIQARWSWVRCAIFLRADIYEKLQFGDRDKFRGDEFHINWDERQLLQLIEARAQASSAGEITPNTLWKAIFPTRMGPLDTKTFLISHTLMRPRDIIQLCNACRDSAKTNGQDSIAESDIRQALALYSNWKLNDLQNEWIVNYPFLPDLFVLLADNSYVVSREAFTLRLKSIEDDLTARYPAVGQLLSADALLSVLYGIGLFGIVRKGVARYVYQEKVDSRVQHNDSQFSIHPCFRFALQSTSAIDLRPFERLSDSERDVYRSRVVRGLRIGNPHEALRAPSSVRAINPIRKNLQSLSGAISKSRIQEEASAEISASLSAVEEELSEASRLMDDAALTIIVQRAGNYLSKLEERLRESALVDPKDELWYLVRSAMDAVQRVGYGALEEDFLR